MKFSYIPVLALSFAGAALAAPAIAESAGANEADLFQPAPDATCSLLSCAAVAGAIPCITSAINADDINALLACAQKSDLCKCTSCYKPLGKFLDKFHSCQVALVE